MNQYDLTRRGALRALAGGAALAIPLSAANDFDDTIPTHDLASPAAQRRIAERAHDLGAELSLVMTYLDGGDWYAIVRPHFMGQANYAIQPMETSPMLRLQRALNMAREALNELQPGNWRQDFSLDTGFAIVTNEDWSAGR